MTSMRLLAPGRDGRPCPLEGTLRQTRDLVRVFHEMALDENNFTALAAGLGTRSGPLLGRSPAAGEDPEKLSANTWKQNPIKS